MITKMQFAKHIVENFAKHVKGFEDFNYDDDFDKVKEFVNEIGTSSSLAVALNFLGVLENENDKDYSNSRSGTFIMRIDTRKNRPQNEEMCQFLSVSEMLEILPDHLE